MAKTPIADKSTAELTSNLNAAKKVHLVTMIIFGVIILAWVVGGYWRKNVPVFISTVAMALAISAVQIASRSGLVAELKRRGEAGG